MRSVCALALLLGCGGPGPRGEAGTLGLELEALVGGGYTGGCLAGEVFWGLRSDRLERWRLVSPPRLEARVALGGLASALGCEGARASVLVDGTLLGVEGAGIAQRGAAAGWPSTKPLPAVPLEGLSVGALADGRAVWFGPWGRGTRSGEDFLEWRRAAGDLRDATFDGKVVWAAGDNGLWRWRPGVGEPTPVALPEGVVGRTYTEVFRDGPFLWLRDAQDRGYPLRVRGGSAVLAAEPGTLPAQRLDESVAVAGQVLTGERGTSGLSAGGRRLATGALSALLPLGEGLLLVGAGTSVALWHLDEDLERSVLAEVELGSPVLRLFMQGGQVIAVGRGFGFALLRLKGAR